MPIYEFFCEDCNTVFNFFSSRINTSKIPVCPKCDKALQRRMSTFSTIGRAKEPDEAGLGEIDEHRMEQALGALAQEAEYLNEDDPRQMAMIMRKFTDKTGLSLGDGMEEALSRMESGEDPEKIEQEMGDILEGEDPLALLSRKAGKAAGRQAPFRDEKLYEL